jgi:hypothetical protein
MARLTEKLAAICKYRRTVEDVEYTITVIPQTARTGTIGKARKAA